MAIQYKKLERIVKSFANHRRIQILDLLNDNPDLSVEEISENLNADFFTISDHIRKLSDAKLVEKKNKGRFVIHRLTKVGKHILSFCKMFK